MPTVQPKFCTSCGSSLVLEARFCAQCGTAIAANDSALHSNAGERRNASIVFVDVAGYTRLTSTRDAEEIHGMLERYFEAVDGVIRHFGGSIDKHIGDAVMGVFGAPVAHGNDAERAVRAGLQIHAAVANLGSGLQVHVGIATGEVVAANLGSTSHREYTVTGDAVNLAARICDRAVANETWVCAATREAIALPVVGDDLGDVPIKGLQHPARLWRVRSIAPSIFGGSEQPIVGRQAELRQFAAALESVQESASGQALLVRGEAGIGKTRLVEEFCWKALDAGFATHKILVLDFGVSQSEDPARQLVCSLLSVGRDASINVVESAARIAIESGWATPDDRVLLNDLLGLPQPAEWRVAWDAMDSMTRQHRRHAVIAGLVSGAAKVRPILIAIEDLHWADSKLLALLATLTLEASVNPVLLIMTTRIEGNPINPEWRSRTGHTPISIFDIGPLRESDALQIAQSASIASADFVQQCIARADGNPLFLVQLLRNASDAGSSTIPNSIQSLVQARADRLPANDRRALQAAAALGQRFILDVLRHLMSDAAYRCDALIERDLVRPLADGFLFAHALIREGVYRSLLRTTRRELHLQASQWYASRDKVLCAEHLELAEDPRAVAAFLEAAISLRQRQEYLQALDLLRRSSKLATTKSDQFAFAALEAELFRELGQAEDAITAHERALSLATSDLDQCRTWIGLADGYRLKGDGGLGRELLESAEAVAVAHKLDMELAQIHRIRGSLDFLAGRTRESMVEQELAVFHARRAGNPEWEARALSGLADALYALGRIRAANAQFCTCIELCRANDMGRIAIAQLPMAAVTRSYFLEIEPAWHDLEAALIEARRALNRRAQIMCHMGASEMLLQMGDLDRAEQHIQEGLALARTTGANWFEAFLLIHLGRCSYRRGNRRDALNSFEHSEKVMPANGARAMGPFLWSSRAIACDDAGSARKALAAGAAILATGAISHNHFWFRRDEIEVMLREHDWRGALEAANALAIYTSNETLPWSDFYIAMARALAAQGAGESDPIVINTLRKQAAASRLVLP